MCEWYDTKRIDDEDKHRRVVLFELKQVEQNAAEDHGHLHLDDVKQDIDYPV